MSTMSIFAKTLPKIGSLEFDAKLEGATNKSVYLTQFPVEFGANMNDHAILLPDRYLLTGAVSNSPLGLDLNDVGMMGIGAVASAERQSVLSRPTCCPAVTRPAPPRPGPP